MAVAKGCPLPPNRRPPRCKFCPLSRAQREQRCAWWRGLLTAFKRSLKW